MASGLLAGLKRALGQVFTCSFGFSPAARLMYIVTGVTLAHKPVA